MVQNELKLSHTVWCGMTLNKVTEFVATGMVWNDFEQGYRVESKVWCGMTLSNITEFGPKVWCGMTFSKVKSLSHRYGGMNLSLARVCNLRYIVWNKQEFTENQGYPYNRIVTEIRTSIGLMITEETFNHKLQMYLIFYTENTYTSSN